MVAYWYRGEDTQDPEGNSWVSGKLEPTETKEAAVRETQEEISHTINYSDLQFLRTYRWNHEDLTITFEVFKAQTLFNAVTVTLSLY
ncbi:MAG TPA: NUDIX domain-containing protein [Verrucomicrobiae bacterium]|nr:NUDIX domain-containing protein [Verrucomicrobiae bacterium]